METALSPRSRLLKTATRLFYSEGIHTVPVDRLVTEANVTRATFYRHFPAKEDLVVAYLRAKDAELRDAAETAAGSGAKAEAVLAVAGPDRRLHLQPGLSRMPFHQRRRRVP